MQPINPSFPSAVEALKHVARPFVYKARELRATARRTWSDSRSYAGSYWVYLREVRQLDTVQSRVLASLNTLGIAIVPFDELVGDKTLWGELDGMAQEFAKSDRVAEGVARYRAIYDKPEGWSSKDYILRQFQENPTIPLVNPLLRLTVLPRVIDIVNHYFEMCTKLHYLDSWYTIPVEGERQAQQSQNWHRDPEDRRVVKVFLYYSDVDETAGPLRYIPGSRREDAKHGKLWSSREEFYPPAEELEKLIPRTEWLSLTGPRGMMVFCDTTGFHKGGYATRTPRLFSTWTYVTPASWLERRFDVDWSDASVKLTRAGEYALRELMTLPSSTPKK